MIIPKYVCSLVYGALIESVASENGARMQAMDSATSNAEEMISTLSLKYNRARQASIMQELVALSIACILAPFSLATDSISAT